MMFKFSLDFAEVGNSTRTRRTMILPTVPGRLFATIHFNITDHVRLRLRPRENWDYSFFESHEVGRKLEKNPLRAVRISIYISFFLPWWRRLIILLGRKLKESP